MKFIELAKSNLSKKYSDLFEGKTENILSDIDLSSAVKATNKYSNFVKRIKSEENEINDSIDKIIEKRNGRLAKEQADADLARKNREAEEKRRRDAIDRARREAEAKKEAKRKAIETFLQTVALISPIILAVVFAIILFSNKEQISIIGNFTGWCTGWVFFTIASLIASIVLLKKRFGDWDYNETPSRLSSVLVAVVMVVFSIIAFSNAGKLSSNFDPTTFITFNVTGKTTSISYSTYYSEISFSVKNNSDVKVTYICGEMKLYNGSTQVGSWNVYFEGEYNGGQSYTTTVEFDERNSTSLYDTPYSNLGVTYRITSMKFNDDWKEYEFNGQTMTVKQGSSGGNQGSNSGGGNQGGSNEHLNEPLSSTTTLLQYLHEDVSNNVIIPDNGITYISYTNNCNCYTADYSKSYIGSGVFFEIDEDYADTLVSDFKVKLSNNGWLCVYDSGYEYEYSKGNTHIVFENVRPSEVWNGYEYIFQYYYMNFDAFNIN